MGLGLGLKLGLGLGLGLVLGLVLGPRSCAGHLREAEQRVAAARAGDARLWSGFGSGFGLGLGLGLG